MKCESCNILEIEVEEPADAGKSPYRICRPCQQRLLNKALRPLEYFNLVSIHGHRYYLQDDFYENESGEALQPDIDVIEAEKFPFPNLDAIKSDLAKLVDYACVQYFTGDRVIELLKLQDKKTVLNCLDYKVKYNRAINYKAYEIAGKVIGATASEWIRQEWDNRKENEILIFAEALSMCLPFAEAFKILTSEIEKSDERRFTENSSALLYFKSSKTLDWIEKNSIRIKNISINWGTLSSTSQFTWVRAEKWLAIGRPLSVIALDALVFCTTTGDRQNQAFWIQQNPPRLMDSIRPEIIAKRLNEYLTKDNVPRTRTAIERIINNIFETTKKESTNR